MTPTETPVFPASRRWAIFLVGFAALFIITVLATAVVQAAVPGRRMAVILVSLIQGAMAFILPCWITWRLTATHPAREIGADRIPTVGNAAGILILYLLALPALDQIIFWNAHISLPESMHGLEESLRQLERNAEAATKAVVDVTGIGDLVVNILVLGIFTGIAEEFFFRAGIQRIMTASGVNRHLAVWVAATVFSAVHFQFFGFFPRLLLGAAFGYVYLWTGSIWNAAIAHALNNTIVVVFAWLETRKILSFDPDMIGVAPDGFPWIALASLTATLIFIFPARRMFFGRNPQKTIK